MKKDFADRVVVVTGAGGGIGRAAARRFGEHGASVALLARGETGLAAAAREVAEAGGRFDARSHGRSLQLRVTQHRSALAAAGIAAALVVLKRKC